jgi:hypothetical protein
MLIKDLEKLGQRHLRQDSDQWRTTLPAELESAGITPVVGGVWAQVTADDGTTDVLRTVRWNRNESRTVLLYTIMPEGREWVIYARTGPDDEAFRTPTVEAAITWCLTQAVPSIATAPESPAAATSKFVPTDEQEAIFAAVSTGQNTTVRALAGVGKTRTLTEIARQRPGSRILYSAFNRTVAGDARRVMPRHVTVSTVDALAFRALRDAHKRRIMTGAVRGDEIADILKITASVETASGVVLDPAGIARAAVTAVRSWAISADPELTRRHLPAGLGASANEVVLQAARAAWQDLLNPAGRVRFTHEHSVKMWALSGPRLPHDLVMFDEAQDANDVWAALLQAQSAQVVVVGDSNQAIYGFRGARDQLDRWPGQAYPLTFSWRFPPEVADVGNRFLELLGSDLRLRGNPAKTGQVGQVNGPAAVLCRTNAGVIAALQSEIDAGRSVAVAGGTTDLERLAQAAGDLRNRGRTNHPELTGFQSWAQVVDFAEADPEGGSLRPLVRLVNDRGTEGVKALVAQVRPDDGTADVTVSTAHVAKGREWPTVRVAGDFRAPKTAGLEGLPAPEELHLSYVAVTRAQQQLDPGSLGWAFDLTHPNGDLSAGRDLQADLRRHSEPTQPEHVIVAASTASPTPTDPADRDDRSGSVQQQPARAEDLPPAPLELVSVEPPQLEVLHEEVPKQPEEEPEASKRTAPGAADHQDISADPSKAHDPASLTPPDGREPGPEPNAGPNQAEVALEQTPDIADHRGVTDHARVDPGPDDPAELDPAAASHHDPSRQGEPPEDPSTSEGGQGQDQERHRLEGHTSDPTRVDPGSDPRDIQAPPPAGEFEATVDAGEASSEPADSADDAVRDDSPAVGPTGDQLDIVLDPPPAQASPASEPPPLPPPPTLNAESTRAADPTPGHALEPAPDTQEITLPDMITAATESPVEQLSPPSLHLVGSAPEVTGRPSDVAKPVPAGPPARDTKPLELLMQEVSVPADDDQRSVPVAEGGAAMGSTSTADRWLDADGPEPPPVLHDERLRRPGSLKDGPVADGHAHAPTDPQGLPATALDRDGDQEAHPTEDPEPPAATSDDERPAGQLEESLGEDDDRRRSALRDRLNEWQDDISLDRFRLWEVRRDLDPLVAHQHAGQDYQAWEQALQALDGAYRTAALHARQLATLPAWQQLASLWDEAKQLHQRVQQAVQRHGADLANRWGPRLRRLGAGIAETVADLSGHVIGHLREGTRARLAVEGLQKAATSAAAALRGGGAPVGPVPAGAVRYLSDQIRAIRDSLLAELDRSLADLHSGCPGQHRSGPADPTVDRAARGVAAAIRHASSTGSGALPATAPLRRPAASTTPPAPSAPAPPRPVHPTR